MRLGQMALPCLGVSGGMWSPSSDRAIRADTSALPRPGARPSADTSGREVPLRSHPLPAPEAQFPHSLGSFRTAKWQARRGGGGGAG